jgi:hypothetical protein
MAQSKGNIEKVNPATIEVEGEEMEVAAGAVESVTTDVPHEADASSQPGPYDDLPVNRPPVSTNDPEVPIAQSLVAGAGAPTPEPELHPETHVAKNAYVSAADKENVQKAEEPAPQKKDDK